jgi:Ribosomal protein S6e
MYYVVLSLLFTFVGFLLRRNSLLLWIWRKTQWRRKSVRRCIVSPDMSVLNFVIIKKGENNLPGLTDIEKPDEGTKGGLQDPQALQSQQGGTCMFTNMSTPTAIHSPPRPVHFASCCLL